MISAPTNLSRYSTVQHTEKAMLAFSFQRGLSVMNRAQAELMVFLIGPLSIRELHGDFQLLCLVIWLLGWGGGVSVKILGKKPNTCSMLLLDRL